jgi:mRNA interferase HigB
MHVISRKTLQSFWELHPQAQQPLMAWFREAKVAHWKTPNEVKKRYRTADLLPGDRVVFNIHGNHYRLVVKMNYDSGTVFIRFVGTHAEYDRIDAESV